MSAASSLSAILVSSMCSLFVRGLPIGPRGPTGPDDPPGGIKRGLRGPRGPTSLDGPPGGYYKRKG